MKRVRMLLLTAALGSAVAACGSGGGTRSQGTPTPSPTAFVLQQWSITAPTTQLHAGNVVVTATNRGSETHELVIVRADDPASLPTKSDGSVDEDKIPEASKPGEIADIKAGPSAGKVRRSMRRRDHHRDAADGFGRQDCTTQRGTRLPRRHPNHAEPTCLLDVSRPSSPAFVSAASRW